MAIDTAEKRRSISGIERLIPGVTPNASKDQEWRQESGWSYSGILSVAPEAAIYPGNASAATLGPALTTVAISGPANAAVSILGPSSVSAAQKSSSN